MVKGWYGDKTRHGLASRGIRTGYKDEGYQSGTSRCMRCGEPFNQNPMLSPSQYCVDCAEIVDMIDKGYYVRGKRVEINWDKDYLTEGEINLIKNRMNRGEDIDLSKMYDLGGLFITPEQTQKGFDWLWNLYKTPRGVERKNNPFGYREEDILENFDHFEITDFYNAGNRYVNWYMPVYRVIGKNGSSFEYTMKQGEIYIIG